MPLSLKKSLWQKLEGTYTSLPLSDPDPNEWLQFEDSGARPINQTYQRQSHGCNALNLFIAFGTFLLSLILILLVSSSLLSSPTPRESAYPNLHSSQLQSYFLTSGPWNYTNPSPCGLSSDSARDAGCRWSAMTFAWYPAACYDEELDREFMELQDWKWYSTDELREEDQLPRDIVLRGDVRKAYMSMEYHKLHCMYSVRKLYRSLMGAVLCDNYILRLGHLEHCERFMLRNDHPAVKGEFSFLPRYF